MNHNKKVSLYVFLSSLLFCFFPLFVTHKNTWRYFIQRENLGFVAIKIIVISPNFHMCFLFLKTCYKYEPRNTKQMSKPMCMIHILASQCSTFFRCVIPKVWTGPLQYLHVLPATDYCDSAKWHLHAVRGTNTYSNMCFIQLILPIWFKLSNVSWVS